MSKVSLSVDASCMTASDYSATHPPQSDCTSLSQKLELNNPVLWLSGSFLSLFVLLAVTSPELLTSLIDSGFRYATQGFECLLATAVIG